MGGVLSIKNRSKSSPSSSSKNSSADPDGLKILVADQPPADPLISRSTGPIQSSKIDSTSCNLVQTRDSEPSSSPPESDQPPSTSTVGDASPSEPPSLDEEQLMICMEPKRINATTSASSLYSSQSPLSSPAAAAGADDDIPPPPPSSDPEPMLSPPIPPPEYNKLEIGEEVLRLNEIKERPPSISLLARRMKSQGPTADAEGERFSEDSSSVMSSPPKQTRRGSAGVLHIPTTGRRNKAIVSSLARRAHQSAQDSNAAPKNRKRFSVSLMEHQHTFFCERKERVCTAAGKLQELETLTIDGDLSLLEENDFVWVRSRKSTGTEASDIESSRGSVQYVVSVEDVGHYIGFRIVSSGETCESFLGPVLPGPPRLLELLVVGKCEVGRPVVAVSRYIGGREGASEYWWLRVDKDGNRENLTAPVAIDPTCSSSFDAIRDAQVHPERQCTPAGGTSSSDPRVYIVTDADVGSELKVKCRPVRDDAVRGEVFTSKASAVVTRQVELTAET